MTDLTAHLQVVEVWLLKRAASAILVPEIPLVIRVFLLNRLHLVPYRVGIRIGPRTLREACDDVEPVQKSRAQLNRRKMVIGFGPDRLRLPSEWRWVDLDLAKVCG